MISSRSGVRVSICFVLVVMVGLMQYPEIWDGYSVGLDFTAVPCIIVGAMP